MQTLIVEEFALLILDIQMPEMTGFQLAQLIRQRKKTAQLPIIFLTAYYHEEQDVLQGYGTALSRVLMSVTVVLSDEHPVVYVIRLIAYGLIILGIIDKNFKRSSSSVSQAEHT